MDLKGLLADQLGLFSAHDIPGVLLGMLLAALLAFALGLLVKAEEGASPRELALFAALVALAVALVRASVPHALALAGVALLVRGPGGAGPWRGFLLRLSAVVLGLGCGTGAGLVTFAAWVPLALLLRWALAPKTS